MGRYYSGDIEGKFWFAVQNSGDADFFGVCGSQPYYLEYYFQKDDLPKVEKGIKECLKALGKNKEKLDRFFEKKDSYNNEMIMKELKITKKKVRGLLEWYARLKLGEKIAKCIKKNGECSFEADL